MPATKELRHQVRRRAPKGLLIAVRRLLGHWHRACHRIPALTRLDKRRSLPPLRGVDPLRG